LRVGIAPRLLGGRATEVAFPDGSRAVLLGDDVTVETVDGGALESRVKTPKRGALCQARGATLVTELPEASLTYARDGSLTYETPAGIARYDAQGITVGALRQQSRHAHHWLIAFTVLLGLLVSSKWYGVMGFGVSFTVLIALALQRWFAAGRPALWGNPRGIRIDVALVAIAFIAATVYTLSWVPDFFRQIEIKNLSDLIYRQYSMFHYHDTLKATHPYQSRWWKWPLDLRPIAYYYHDFRTNPSNPAACCVAEILSLPNPLILWAGLITVPIVGYLAWIRRNKGYALIVLAYLLQWLPWMASPRITFEYHYYVDIPLVCICNAVALQEWWRWARTSTQSVRWVSAAGIAAYVAAVGWAFIYFYPILAAVKIPYDAWLSRMWLGRFWI
ncbi:MAG: dolichyl-phosphate-mannose--protein mannosyltransferase, partial [Vulcanimicrobiaceae bacterium]